MKKLYTSIVLAIFAITLQAQTFDFSLSFIGVNPSTNNYQMALMATPNASVTDGNTADMGAGFYIPTGLTIGNFETGNSNLPASEWTSQSLGATNANGDPYFVSRIEAGSTSVLLNGAGPFELVIFDIIADPNPTSGDITFVENGDPVFNEILFIENYMNINLGSGTTNAYAQNDPSANSIQFSTLSIDDSFAFDNSISIYPNPSKNIVTINTKLDINAVELYDITGKLIGKHQNNTLDISHLDSGIYLIKINVDNTTITKRLIKE
ncbi:T9SS type A sorting domain-containing protein [Winogradskyella sp. PE311]|uniref:T9SS type A sorting domain-containing protein n=1 Tax=Winogradskyella sp. PE311 TaxID=3366943 RepID=UPI00397F2348